jgi:hypothetical protein
MIPEPALHLFTQLEAHKTWSYQRHNFKENRRDIQPNRINKEYVGDL